MCTVASWSAECVCQVSVFATLLAPLVQAQVCACLPVNDNSTHAVFVYVSVAGDIGCG